MLAYASWLRRQVGLDGRLARLLRRGNAGLSMGGYALLDGGQFQGVLGLGLTLVRWGLLLLGG